MVPSVLKQFSGPPCTTPFEKEVARGTTAKLRAEGTMSLLRSTPLAPFARRRRQGRAVPG